MAESSADQERALDTIATILRTLGSLGFDLDELDAEQLRDQCDAWAQKILVGHVKEGQARLVRDFAGVCWFVNNLRRKESEYVKRSLSDLRQAIWTFVRGMSRTVTAERTTDDEIREQLQRLHTAVDSSDTSALKREAIAAVEMLSRHLDQRQQRQRQLMREMSARVQTLQSRLSTTTEPAMQDPLTRLHGRKALDEQLERIADLGVLVDRPVHLMVIDVDQMKSVNEAYGTSTGDEVLRQIGKCLLRQFFRREDLVARCGGDEFALLSYETSAKAVEAVAQRILGAVRQLEMRAIGRTIHVTASIGVASQVPGEPAAVWLERAYRAMLQCRRRGGNGVLLARPDPV